VNSAGSTNVSAVEIGPDEGSRCRPDRAETLLPLCGITQPTACVLRQVAKRHSVMPKGQRLGPVQVDNEILRSGPISDRAHIVETSRITRDPGQPSIIPVGTPIIYVAPSTYRAAGAAASEVPVRRGVTSKLAVCAPTVNAREKRRRPVEHRRSAAPRPAPVLAARHHDPPSTSTTLAGATTSVPTERREPPVRPRPRFAQADAALAAVAGRLPESRERGRQLVAQAQQLAAK